MRLPAAKSGDAYVDVTAAVDVGGKNEQEKPQVFLVTFRLAEKNSELRIIDLKLAESSLILSYRTRFYELFAADDGDVEWFLEDLENMTSSAEKANDLRSQGKIGAIRIMRRRFRLPTPYFNSVWFGNLS